MPTAKITSRVLLAAAVSLALFGPAAARADEAREAALEARIEQLERLVAELVAERAAAPVAAAAAPAPAPAAPAIQTTPILPAANPGTRFSAGGFIKLDAMVSDTSRADIPDGSAGHLFYLPQSIPVAGESGGADADFHAQFSRLWFGADGEFDGRPVRAYLEFDLFGGALGNEASTNTYGVTVRHAFVSWDRWLAGQTWSNFQDVAALPDAVDFIGPTEGTTFVRQAQVRYTNGPWSLSIENPETVLTPYRAGAGRLASDDGALPDLTARWTRRGDWGHVGIAALLRSMRHEALPGADSSETGFGLSGSGRFNLGARDDLRWMVTAGRGIGRYVGLGLSTDAVLDDGGDLHATDLVAGFVGWRHVFNPRLRGNLFYSRAEIDNDTALTGLGITRRAHSAHANLIYSPLPKLDIGAELIWGQRETEDGASGELRRLHTHVKYSF